MDSAGGKEVNGSADPSSDDDDFGDFAVVDEVVVDNIGYEGASSSISPQHPEPRIHSTDSSDAFLSHARSKFQHLFVKYSQADPTGELDTGENSPDQPPPSVTEILVSFGQNFGVYAVKLYSPGTVSLTS